MCSRRRPRAFGASGTMPGRNGETPGPTSSSKNISSSCRPAWTVPVSCLTRWRKYWIKSEKSVNSRLTVTETVELLNQLKATVRDCATAEEKLNRELRANSELAEKRSKEEVTAREKQSAERLKEAEADFQATRERIKARHKYWAAHISKARHSSERLGFRRIDEAEGQRKHPLQKALLDTRKRREESLKANDAWLKDFRAQLAAARENFEALEQAAKKTLRGVRRGPP